MTTMSAPARHPRSPADLRALSPDDLPQLAPNCANSWSNRSPSTGGHLASNLGTVELTLALHYVFDTPRDRIVWDVGHQTYPHKILTGRRAGMAGLRQGGGIAGFPRRAEERIRRLRRRPFQHLDLGRARHGRGLPPAGLRASARWRSSATAR
jgi:deoxyxylulose-5-phosphate synthase